MKTEKINTTRKKLSKKIIVNPELNNKYLNEPLFKEKVEKTNQIIKKFGLPKF